MDWNIKNDQFHVALLCYQVVVLLITITTREDCTVHYFCKKKGKHFCEKLDRIEMGVGVIK